MRTTELLTRPLECDDSSQVHWTIPSGLSVTVHHSATRPIVVLDGRIYRASNTAVRWATQ